MLLQTVQFLHGGTHGAGVRQAQLISWCAMRPCMAVPCRETISGHMSDVMVAKGLATDKCRRRRPDAQRSSEAEHWSEPPAGEVSEITFQGAKARCTTRRSTTRGISTMQMSDERLYCCTV